MVLDLTNYWDQVTVTDDDIEAQYQGNSDRYYLPADTQVDYLALSVEALAAELVLEEEEIRRAYDSSADRFVQPESRSVRHVLVSLDEGAGEAAVETARVKAAELVGVADPGKAVHLLQVHIAVGERTVAVGKVAEFDLRAEQQRHVQHAVHRFHPTDGF